MLLAGLRAQELVEAGAGGAGVDDPAFHFVFAKEDAAFRVGCSVARVDEHAEEARYGAQAGHTAVARLLVEGVLPKAGGRGVDVEGVAACWDGCCAVAFAGFDGVEGLILAQPSVGVFEGVAEVAAVNVETPDGVALAAGDAMEVEFHFVTISACFCNLQC